MADGALVAGGLAAAGRAAAFRGRPSCKPAGAGCFLAVAGALVAGGDLAAVTLAAGGTLPVLAGGVLAGPGCLVPDALAAGPFLAGAALAGVCRLVLSGALTVPVTLFLTPGFF